MRRRGIDNRWLYIVLIVLFIIWLIGKVQLETHAQESDPFNEPTKVRCTCYIDDGVTASGQDVRPNIIAGKCEWLGCVACINAVNEDGSIGEFIGYYEFCDTGYGRETGEGESKILKGKTLGTIETGQTVDVWQPTMHAAEEWVALWGDYVYITIIRGEG